MADLSLKHITSSQFIAGIDAQIRCLRMQPVNYKMLADALNKYAQISNENENKKIGRKVTNEDIKSGKISLEEVLISRHFVDRNNENHSLFCYGDYYGEMN